jgi:hypothetical protein
MKVEIKKNKLNLWNQNKLYGKQFEENYKL